MNIKRLIKNTKIKTNPQVSKIVLNGLLEMLDKSKVAQPNIPGIFVKSRIAKFAVAAGIITAVYLFFNYNHSVPIEAPKIAQISEPKTPAQLTTIISLNMAFGRGGMDAVEKQFVEADKKAGQSLKERVTIKQLLCELNDCEEI